MGGCRAGAQRSDLMAEGVSSQGLSFKGFCLCQGNVTKFPSSGLSKSVSRVHRVKVRVDDDCGRGVEILRFPVLFRNKHKSDA